MKTYLDKAVSLFFIAGFICIPLTFYGPGYQYLLTKFLFLKPVAFIQTHFFSDAIKNIDFSSDTIALNILLCLLFVIAVVAVLVLHLLKIRSAKIVSFTSSLSAYYIAFILLKYGVDKITRRQFYLPEPNILYARFGNLTRDTLYWSTIGTSYTYSVVTGIIEVIAAVLLLIKRTRVAGFCLSLVILANILLVNIGFDISVKTFTLFLLAVVLFSLYPYLKNIYAFFVLHKPVQLSAAQPPPPRYHTWVKPFLVAGMLCYVLFPYVSSGNFNDDKAERPLLHGAYSIHRFIIGNDTLSKADFPYKKFFIHRNSYIIFQQDDDTMVDYFFDINPVKKQLVLQDYKENKITVAYDYNEKTGALRLQFGNSGKWAIESTSLDWKNLPALQGKTHYTIDEIK